MVRPLTPLMLVLVALTSCKFSLATPSNADVIPLQNDGKKFFDLVKEKKNWDDARKFCNDLGYEGDLAAFPSYGEWEKIEKQVWNHTATKLWIGGSCKKSDVCEDKDATVAWRWVTGEPIPVNAHGNIQWKVNEPLVHNKYFKLLLLRNPGDNDIGSLSAGQASDKQWFICRKTENPCKNPKNICKNICKNPSVQFEDIWRPTLQEIAHEGLAKIFNTTKLKGSTKLAIIGAGPAGLTAAYELAKYAIVTNSSLQITIFEKTDRVGGRVKTVGEPGELLPEIWHNKEAFSDAGAMRLPLPPQYEFQCLEPFNLCQMDPVCQMNISKMNDKEISDVVHQKGNYSFVKDDVFPMFLMRHYIKEFNIPVKRFNMDVSAKNVFGNIFVYKGGAYICNGCGRDGKSITIDESVLEKVRSINTTFADLLTNQYSGSLDKYFQKSLTDKVKQWFKSQEKDQVQKKINLTVWNNFQTKWSDTVREYLAKEEWPEAAIELYGLVYGFAIDQKIAMAIIENDLGKWWQKLGMFCPKEGMHSVYRKTNNSNEEVTAFYDKLLELNSSKENSFRINFYWNSKVKRIKKMHNESILVFKESTEDNLDLVNVGDFDAVIITVPVNFLQDLEILNHTNNIAPLGTGFGTLYALFKLHMQFKTPFWLNSSNNIGEFNITNTFGFVKSTAIVGQFRYPRSDETGNIIMLYVFNEKAQALSHKVDQQGFMKNHTATWAGGLFNASHGIQEILKMTLRELQKFHPSVEVTKMFTGNFFVQPWVQLSSPPTGLYEMRKMRCYCDESPKGIYFAGDGFSFKPQWQEGALYAAYHAIWRLVNDLTDSRKDDPFKVLDEKSIPDGDHGGESWHWWSETEFD